MCIAQLYSLQVAVPSATTCVSMNATCAGNMVPMLR